MDNYLKGDKIISLDEFSNQQFVFIKDKLYHYGFIQSMQFRYILSELKKGEIFKALKKENENG